MNQKENCMKATFPVASGRGAECPFCDDDDFMSRGIEVSAKNEIFTITETCSKCHQKWDEQMSGLRIEKTTRWGKWKRWIRFGLPF